MLDVIFGSGIDSWGCTLDAALDLDIVERRGSWYAYKGQQLAQGRHNVVEFLKTDEIGEAIKEDVRVALANYGKVEIDDEDDDTDVELEDPEVVEVSASSAEELQSGFD